MANKRANDPMAGLLSEVSGLDGALFAKPSSMNDMKSRGHQQSPLGAKPSASDSGRGMTGMQASPPFNISSKSNPLPMRTPEAQQPTIDTAFISLSSSYNVSGSQSKTSSLSGRAAQASPHSEAGHLKRMMEQQRKGGPTHSSDQSGASTTTPSSNIDLTGIDDLLGPSSTARAGAYRSGGQAQNRGGSRAIGDFGQGAAAVQSGGSPDPFDIFQTPAKGPASVGDPHAGHGDLLGGFEGSLGVVDHSDASFASNPDSTRGDLAFGSKSNLSIPDDDWGSMASASTASSTPATPTQVPKPQPAPPSYNEAMGQEPHPRAASAKCLAPSRNEFERETDVGPSNLWETESDGGHVRGKSGQSRPAPGRQHVGSFGALDARAGPSSSSDSMAENAKEQARMWLQTGQTWLKTATAKVSKATKEAGAALQKGLEDLDSRFVQKGAGGSSSQARISDEQGVPKYYHDWADKIAQLSPGRRANTLAQLPEDDRLIVQRILDSAAVSASASGSFQGNESVGERDAQEVEDSPPLGVMAAGHLLPACPPKQAGGPSSNNVWGNAKASPALAPQSSPKPIPQPPASSQPSSRPAAASWQDSREEGLTNSGGRGRGTSTPASPSEPAARTPPGSSGQAGPEMEADLLGLHGTRGEAPPSAKPGSEKKPKAPGMADLLGTSQSAPSTPGLEEDLLGLHDSTRGAATPKPSGAGLAATTSDVDLLHAFAQASPVAPGSASPAVPSRGVHADLEEMFGAPRPAAGRAPGNAMIDFGDDDDVPDGHGALYEDAELGAEGDEPEHRRILRERRIAEKHMRMRQKLAEKQARDEAESSEKAAKVELREKYKSKIETWQAGKRDNIRALLSSLDSVLWPDSGWKSPGLTDLVEPNKVKRWYMKANLIVHPDKVKQKGGTVEQIVMADMAFDVLKVAWGKFESELRA